MEQSHSCSDCIRHLSALQACRQRIYAQSKQIQRLLRGVEAGGEASAQAIKEFDAAELSSMTASNGK